jgi:hypothetical protein
MMMTSRIWFKNCRFTLFGWLDMIPLPHHHNNTHHPRPTVVLREKELDDRGVRKPNNFLEGTNVLPGVAVCLFVGRLMRVSSKISSALVICRAFCSVTLVFFLIMARGT